MLPATALWNWTLIPHCHNHSNRKLEQQCHVADDQGRGSAAVPPAGSLVGKLGAAAHGQSSHHAVNWNPYLKTLMVGQPGVFGQAVTNSVK